jgi:hypothetical protein
MMRDAFIDQRDRCHRHTKRRQDEIAERIQCAILPHLDRVVGSENSEPMFVV